MGGRGARFGKEKNDKGEDIPYGSTYKAVAELGDNIKIIRGRKGAQNANSTPMESQTKNRVYGVLSENGKYMKSIVFINQNGKRYKQIDFGHTHNNLSSGHKHKGYIHEEHGSTGKLTRKEKNIVKKIYKYAKNNGIIMA